MYQYQQYQSPQYPYQMPPMYDVRSENYRQLRRHGTLVGCCLLGFFALQEIFFVVMMLLGYDDVFYSNPAYQYAVSAAVFSFLAMGVPFFAYSCKKGSLSYNRVISFHTPQPRKKTVCLILAGWGMCIIGNYIAIAGGSFFTFFGVEEAVSDSVASTTALDVAMNFLCSAVMAPLVEEFVFRGVIMQPLRRYGDSFAVIATASIFALAHGSPTNIIFAFVAGLAIGYAVVYSRSLWVGIIIHALNNGFSVFFTEIYDFAPEAVDMIYVIACAAVAALGIAAFIIFGRKYGLKLQPDLSGLNGGKKIVGFFASVPMVLALLYFVFTISASII